MAQTPFDPAAMLRGLAEPNSVLSGLLRLLDHEWARFHDRPDAEALARVEDLARAIQAHHSAVDTVLNAPGAAGTEGTRQPSVPTRKEPIAHDMAGSPAEPPVHAEPEPPVHAEPEPPAQAEPEPPVQAEPEPPQPPRTTPAPSAEAPTELAYPPFRDQTTGLFTREGFDAAASGELKKCRRHERPFAILLLQLGVRDDEALRQAAATIRRVVRESDLAGRHVDRTFAVGLSEAAISEARLVAGRIIETLEEGMVWGSTGRIGLAGYPVDGETLPGLLEVARGQLSLMVNEVLERSRRSG